MFVGRNEELKLIHSLLEKTSASIMIYGKRKVGKTTLIKKGLENSTDKTIYFECLKAPLEDNIESFVNILVKENVLPVKLNFTSFSDIFSYLNSFPKTFNIVIDEYPYLKAFTKSETIDSIFQSIIDNYITNIRLFISGSQIGMMKDLFEERNALYGRFTTSIHLTELDYISCAQFYNNKSIYDKIGFYSVFGGSPYINQALDANLSLKENIINTLLNPSSNVYTYTEYLLISDYTNTINAERIFYAIANGHKKYSDIEAKLNIKANGNLSKQLNILENMEIIAKVYPINKTNDKKKVYYEIKDNLLRFYYTYIYRNKSALQILGADAFFDEYIKDSLTTFISHRFEEIVRTYFSLCVKRKRLFNVSNIGTLYYDDRDNKTNGEFDVVIAHKNEYDIYEVKYYTSPMQTKEMYLEAKQVNAITNLNVKKIGFICTAGYEENIKDFDCIDIEKLYNI